MKCDLVQYYVEGQDEEKLINVLKSELRVIKPGRIQCLNVVESQITDARLRTLAPKTMVVLVFDTDTGNVDILHRNLERLRACSSVCEIVTIPQVRSLEDELVRACSIRSIVELLNSKSRGDFKRDINRTSNLGNKLREHGFDIRRFWSSSPTSPYHTIENQAERIKMIK